MKAWGTTNSASVICTMSISRPPRRQLVSVQLFHTKSDSNSSYCSCSKELVQNQRRRRIHILLFSLCTKMYALFAISWSIFSQIIQVRFIIEHNVSYWPQSSTMQRLLGRGIEFLTTWRLMGWKHPCWKWQRIAKIVGVLKLQAAWRAW